jgi:hypothetical protein
MIYILLPFDDIYNCKVFEIESIIQIINKFNNDKNNNDNNNNKLYNQEKEILELTNKINQNINGGFNDLEDNILCNINNKTDTKIYQEKYKKTQDVLLSNINNSSNSLILINNLIILMDSNTNITNYNKLYNDYYQYNEKYYFENNMNLKNFNPIIIEKKNINNEGNSILNFITSYLINNVKNINYKNKYLKYKAKYIYLKNKFNYL